VGPSLAHLQVIEADGPTGLSAYRLSLSRPAVAAGPVSVQAINRSQDPHTLRIAALAGGAPTAAPSGWIMSFPADPTATLSPGQLLAQTATLSPGSYLLFCDLPGHYASMHALLVVA
jgi:hypothetical protein